MYIAIRVTRPKITTGTIARNPKNLKLLPLSPPLMGNFGPIKIGKLVSPGSRVFVDVGFAIGGLVCKDRGDGEGVTVNVAVCTVGVA